MADTVFIGGGNMARALIGGALRSGAMAAGLLVVEPDADQRERLRADLGVTAIAAPDARLAAASLVVWAVKPQTFAAAAASCAGRAAAALQLSVMAGVRSAAVAGGSGAPRVVRAMPNTPALIGEGIAALFATAAVSQSDRSRCEALLQSTGEVLWVASEAQLDAVTAVSGSGPAYVFYLLEAMVEAGTALGLAPPDALRLARQTVRGSGLLAAGSSEAPAQLRTQVTSKGGTTQAALDVLEAHGVRAAFVEAIAAAARRAVALGDELEAPPGPAGAFRTGVPPSR